MAMSTERMPPWTRLTAAGYRDPLVSTFFQRMNMTIATILEYQNIIVIEIQILKIHEIGLFVIF